MPRYQIYFDTNQGEKKFNVDIDDTEIIEDVLRDMLGELAERGLVMKGMATGDLRVIWNGQELDLSSNLPNQQVLPNEVLRVLVESYKAGAGGVRKERIEQEWRLLNQLVGLNPSLLELLGRKSRPNEDKFGFKLKQSPGIAAIDEGGEVLIRREHTMNLRFPQNYPDVPIECYVKEPLFHPNVRLDTGYVCVWASIRLEDTAIQAVCRAQAIAAFRMVNLGDPHVMNPEAAAWLQAEGSPSGLVPLEGEELRVYRSVDGRLDWLEPGRFAPRQSRRYSEL